MTIKNKCFCGANATFENCCLPYINSEKTPRVFPQTPEQLMRSRFSAYASGNNQYIFDTYAKNSQSSQSVKEIKAWGDSCKWIALKIHSASTIEKVICNTKPNSSEQFVEFSAFYITENTLFELRENSRFVLEANIEDTDGHSLHWHYLDGNIIKHSELTEIKRKDLCPCNLYSTAWSLKKGKKYKQCCGK